MLCLICQLNWLGIRFYRQRNNSQAKLRFNDVAGGHALVTVERTNGKVGGSVICKHQRWSRQTTRSLIPPP